MMRRLSGVHPSPLGISLVVLLVIGSIYYLVMFHSPASLQAVSMKEMLIAGIDFAERGGVQVKSVHDEHELEQKSKGKTLEGADDPLTKGDLLSHQAMMEAFQTTFPQVKIVSEEKAAVSQSSFIKKAPLYNREVDSLVTEPDDLIDSKDITVWIDPLDATKEYTEDLLQYVTTMVCVAVKGVPVIGVIHKPFEKKTYWSWVGHGSNIEIEPNQDQAPTVIVSRSHAGDVKEKATKAFGKDVKIEPAGGAGFKTLALFNGKALVYVHTTLIKKWDICSGSAILRQAGGKMTTLKGEDIDFSYSSNPKNKGGLLAARTQHDVYLEKLGPVL